MWVQFGDINASPTIPVKDQSIRRSSYAMELCLIALKNLCIVYLKYEIS